jgi:hypothetical protein
VAEWSAADDPGSWDPPAILDRLSSGQGLVDPAVTRA